MDSAICLNHTCSQIYVHIKTADCCRFLQQCTLIVTLAVLSSSHQYHVKYICLQNCQNLLKKNKFRCLIKGRGSYLVSLFCSLSNHLFLVWKGIIVIIHMILIIMLNDYQFSLKLKETHFWCGLTDGDVEVHKTQKTEETVFGHWCIYYSLSDSG